MLQKIIFLQWKMNNFLEFKTFVKNQLLKIPPFVLAMTNCLK